MDGGNIYVGYAGIFSEDGEERNEGVVVILGLVVEDDARFVDAGFTNQWLAHCLFLVLEENYLHGSGERKGDNERRSACVVESITFSRWIQ